MAKAKLDAQSLKTLIEQAEDTKIVPFFVEEWDVTVYIKTLTGQELMDFRSYPDQSKDHDIYLLSLSLCDEDGNRLFGFDEMETLKRKSWAAIVKLTIVAQKVNRFDEESFEELKKNLQIPQ